MAAARPSGGGCRATARADARPGRTAQQPPSAHKGLLATKRRRLHILEIQAARKGYDVPADVAMEIEDVQQEIAALEAGDG